jgi:hypothetical protein
MADQNLIIWKMNSKISFVFFALALIALCQAQVASRQGLIDLDKFSPETPLTPKFQCLVNSMLRNKRSATVFSSGVDGARSLQRVWNAQRSREQSRQTKTYRHSHYYEKRGCRGHHCTRVRTQAHQAGSQKWQTITWEVKYTSKDSAAMPATRGKLTCPKTFYKFKNIRCVANCPRKFKIRGDRCVRRRKTPVKIACPRGFRRVGTKCEQIKTSSTGIKTPGLTVTCPVGQQNVNGHCQAIACGPGEVRVGNTCNKKACAPHQKMENGVCKTTSCPAGYSIVNNKCFKLDCAAGYKKVNGKCRKIRCRRGRHVVGNKCQPRCDRGKGLRWNGFECEYKKCPPGYVMKQINRRTSRCVKECDRGFIKGPDGKCTRISCKRNFKLENGKCIRVGCPNGLKLINGKCSKVNCPVKGQAWSSTLNKCYQRRCPKGLALVDGVCKSINCQPGQELYKGKCVNLCRRRFKRDANGICVRESCGKRFKLENGKCIRVSCPSSYHSDQRQMRSSWLCYRI